MTIIVNDLPQNTELATEGVEYSYRTRRKNRLIRFYPGAGTSLDQADLDYDGYFYSGYVVNNPGYVANTYISFAGIYISANGEYTGTYIANTEVEQY